MSEPIISISGLRGIVGSELTPAIAMRYASALCAVAPPGPIVLSRDGRVSGPMLADAIAATVMALGRDCLDLGIASTPSAGYFVRHSRSAGGIQVSASHNPPPYNGMKLFGNDGRVIGADLGRMVMEAYHVQTNAWVNVDRLGKRIPIEAPWEPHLRAVLATVDVEMIRQRAFRVLLDSNHGSGGELGRQLLKELGCKLEIKGPEPTGLFFHPPEPIAENLHSVCTWTREGAFQVGFCQDPDADRLAIIDEQGIYIGEEFTSVLCAMSRISKEKGPLVTNCASSKMMEWLANKNGVPFVQSAVGEANVADAMLANQAVYGGEGSGGPIDPKVGYIRDSFVGMAQVLELMAKTNCSISQLVAKLPPSAMIKDKMVMSKESLLRSIDTLKERLNADRLSLLDGVRLDWETSWLLLRASNTEPIVRLIAEAPTHDEAQKLIENAKMVIAQVVEPRTS